MHMYVMLRFTLNMYAWHGKYYIFHIVAERSFQLSGIANQHFTRCALILQPRRFDTKTLLVAKLDKFPVVFRVNVSRFVALIFQNKKIV